MRIAAAMLVFLGLLGVSPLGLAAPPPPKRAPAAAAAKAAPTAVAVKPKAAPATPVKTAAPARPAASAKTATASGSVAASAGEKTAAAPTSTPASAAAAAPGATTAAKPVTAPVSKPAAAAADGSGQVVRLRDLEQRIDELKEQIRRSHTRLSLLSENILASGGGGAHAAIKFVNEMGGAFKLKRLLIVLDGAVQYSKEDDSDSLASLKEIPLFTGTLPPGDHTLQVAVEWRGHGFGVFSYLRGYQFKSRSSHSFTVPGGKTLELDVIAWEKGGITTPLEERPAVRYVERLKDRSQTRLPAANGSAAAR